MDRHLENYQDISLVISSNKRELFLSIISFFQDLKERAVSPKGRSLRADGSLFLFYKGILSRIYQWEQFFLCLEDFTFDSKKLQAFAILKY
jgi:hypothetical protein